MILSRKRRVYIWSRRVCRSRACSTLLTGGKQVSYNRPSPQHLLHLWLTWSEGWKTHAQFHVLSVHRHDTSISHVSYSWQRGTDWNLKGYGGWTLDHDWYIIYSLDCGLQNWYCMGENVSDLTHTTSTSLMVNSLDSGNASLEFILVTVMIFFTACRSSPLYTQLTELILHLRGQDSTTADGN